MRTLVEQPIDRASGRVQAAAMAGARGIRLLVYGRSPAHWLRVLAPDGPLWPLVPEVGEVQLLRSSLQVLQATLFDREAILLPLLERHLLRAPRLCHGLLAPAGAIRTLADKRRFAAFAAAAHLGAHLPEAIDIPGPQDFPLVLKRHEGSSGKGVAIAGDAAELVRLRTQEPFAGRPTLLQRYAGDGTDHVTHCVCVAGRIVWHRCFAYTLRPGTRVQRPDDIVAVEPVAEQAAHLALFERLLLPLGFEGPCNIDTRRLPDGRTIILEINPRFGSSLFRPEHLATLAEALRAIIANARPLRRGAGRTGTPQPQ